MNSNSNRFAGYSLQHLQKDLVSGSIVGIIAIPLGMAFAIASGVKPEYGIYTTIVAGILISLFGGTSFQIGGPTGAFVPILFSIVMTYGYENLLIAGMMAGIILVIMGLLRLGSFIHYIPKPVTIGFTAGIAVIIFSGQIPNFLGLQVEKHDAFLLNMKEIVVHLDTINPYSVITALLCLGSIFLSMKLFPKVPSSLIGLVVSSVAASFFFAGKVATIGSTYGAIPGTLPALAFPEITLDKLVQLIRPALVIALLGGIESLLSAVVADNMAGTRHNSNRELIGQGIANIITPLFGGIPATGAIARTATNIKNGAASPLSGVIHGIVVLLVLLLFAPYASLIPLASMAPILMVVAWNMSERREFLHLLKTRTSDSLLLLTTFLLTVFTDLTIAVEVGLGLAVLLFTKKMSQISISKALPDPSDSHKPIVPHMVYEGHDCPQLHIYNMEGPLFFAASKRMEESIVRALQTKPKIVLLRMAKVPLIDTTGVAQLAALVSQLKRNNCILLVCGLGEQPKQMLQKTGLYDQIGPEHFLEHTGDAVLKALSYLDRRACQGCRQFVFDECSQFSQTALHHLPHPSST
ncbi:sulfate permease [Brevibacillus sp. SYP-B805]|uniref:SulP family inorganic anion transporter n=1 Tax=Brevibacillus sp. SYP-B805 TaxID=1578199 RepID=UPI0013EB80E4|nr:sulfate permease [Brevibacillus sp. SYP-B805]NGQ93747.1 sulfate permease [Brevibacillus sp. SYP-B805]